METASTSSGLHIINTLNCFDEVITRWQNLFPSVQVIAMRMVYRGEMKVESKREREERKHSQREMEGTGDACDEQNV